MTDFHDRPLPGDPVGYSGTGGWRRAAGDGIRPVQLDDADFAAQRALARELEGFLATPPDPPDPPEAAPAPAGRPETPRDEPGASRRPPRHLRALPDPAPAPARPHPRDVVRAIGRALIASLDDRRDELEAGGDRP